MPENYVGAAMESLDSKSLMSVLLSKCANVYYLEHCRVLCNGGRVEYVTDEGKRSLYWNIPIANTTTVLLGAGTSLTQAAMRAVAKVGVWWVFKRFKHCALSEYAPIG